MQCTYRTRTPSAGICSVFDAFANSHLHPGPSSIFVVCMVAALQLTMNKMNKQALPEDGVADTLQQHTIRGGEEMHGVCFTVIKLACPTLTATVVCCLLKAADANVPWACFQPWNCSTYIRRPSTTAMIMVVTRMIMVKQKMVMSIYEDDLIQHARAC